MLCTRAVRPSADKPHEQNFEARETKRRRAGKFYHLSMFCIVSPCRFGRGCHVGGQPHERSTSLQTLLCAGSTDPKDIRAQPQHQSYRSSSCSWIAHARGCTHCTRIKVGNSPPVRSTLGSAPKVYSMCSPQLIPRRTMA